MGVSCHSSDTARKTQATEVPKVGQELRLGTSVLDRCFASKQERSRNSVLVGKRHPISGKLLCGAGASTLETNPSHATRLILVFEPVAVGTLRPHC